MGSLRSLGATGPLTEYPNPGFSNARRRKSLLPAVDALSRQLVTRVVAQLAGVQREGRAGMGFVTDRVMSQVAARRGSRRAASRSSQPARRRDRGRLGAGSYLNGGSRRPRALDPNRDRRHPGRDDRGSEPTGHRPPPPLTGSFARSPAGSGGGLVPPGPVELRRSRTVGHQPGHCPGACGTPRTADRSAPRRQALIDGSRPVGPAPPASRPTGVNGAGAVEIGL